MNCSQATPMQAGWTTNRTIGTGPRRRFSCRATPRIAFETSSAQVADANPELALLCTGPWPPYSFVKAGERATDLERACHASDATLGPRAKDHSCAGRSGPARSVCRHAQWRRRRETPERIVTDPKRSSAIWRVLCSVSSSCCASCWSGRLYGVWRVAVLSEDEIERLGDNAAQARNPYGRTQGGVRSRRPGIVSGFGPTSRSGFGVRVD